ncbi:hypothetical protein BUALT_Bualt05G0082300 [Buddleja alternifolia]|uniref:Uncharacterized protein n=1 Tax=Buddleja alternifolia TaxID=168488 RepID=A0AAV6XPI9_9LAMI|nr:hypothetical protein BUALT_Bualt05G0082300 [Buddleja alternifolia]
MSMNCLKRMDSEEDVRANKLNELQDSNKPNFSLLLGMVERSFSGTLTPNFRPKPNYPKMRSRSNLGPTKKPNNGPTPLHLAHNCGPAAAFESSQATPRLVRSSGMRRDWSFEDLRRALEG